MAFPLIRSLLLAGLLSILLLAAMQNLAQAEPVLTSYYGTELAGNPTASGEPFDPYGLTAAHPSLPFGTLLTVTYNDRSVTVRVNDRGPFVPGRGLDLSLGAAQVIGLTDSGPAVVDMVEDGETSKANSPVPESETTEPARQPRDVRDPRSGSSTNTTISSGNRVVDSISECSSLWLDKADATYGATSSPKSLLATRLMEAKGEQMIQTPYVRPASLRRRKSMPGEEVA